MYPILALKYGAILLIGSFVLAVLAVKRRDHSHAQANKRKVMLWDLANVVGLVSAFDSVFQPTGVSMRFRKTTISFLFFAGSHVAAQQPAEPKYIDQYSALVGSQLIPLERQTVATDTKSRRNFVISPNTKVFKSISGTASPIRVSPSVHFLVKPPTADRDPQTLVHLQKLTVSKKDRQILIVTYKQSVIPFGGVKHDRAPDASIPVTITKYGQNSLEIAPATQLEPGEYAFIEGFAAQCFGVDAARGGDSVVAVPTTAAAPQTSIPQPTPPLAHPAASVVDLPPAALGYPPLHASAPAQEGCWWVPFVAQKLSLEMLVLNCEPGKWMGGSVTRFIAGTNGVSALLDGTNDATELFTIFSKPAAQTITAAIQQQFISKLQVPMARTSCRATRNTQVSGPGETYEVNATGLYSRRKEFDNSDSPGENPCPGLSSDDVTGRSFRYLPQDSKTKFIFFQIQELWPLDSDSIRLHED